MLKSAKVVLFSLGVFMLKRLSVVRVLILAGLASISAGVSSAAADDVTAATKAQVSLVPNSPVFPKFELANGIAEEKITAKDLEQLENGKVLIKSRPVPKGFKGTHVAGMAIIDATTQQVFDVVMDCTGQVEFVPHLEACKNTYAEGVQPATAIQYDQYQKLKFGFGFVSKTIEYTNSMFAIRPYISGWVLKKGDIEQSEGYWRVIPYKDGKQIIVYDVYNNPGMAVPDWVQEILIKSDLPNTIKVFRDRVLSQKTAKLAK